MEFASARRVKKNKKTKRPKRKKKKKNPYNKLGLFLDGFHFNFFHLCSTRQRALPQNKHKITKVTK
jgi:regulator of replication initiation timing